MVSFDLDMTLLDHKTWKIPDSAMEAIERMRGRHRIVLATGRDIDVDYPDYEPCHRLFGQHGVIAVENAGGDIDQVTGKRMTICAFPFRCEAADGGMVRLVAWEEGTKW